MGATENSLLLFVIAFFGIVLGYCFLANFRAIQSGEYDKMEKARKRKRGERWEAEG